MSDKNWIFCFYPFTLLLANRKQRTKSLPLRLKLISMGAHAVKMPVGTRKTVSIILVIAVMVLTLGTIDQSRKLVTFSGERMKSDAIGVDKFYTLRGNLISQPVGALNSKKSGSSSTVVIHA